MAIFNSELFVYQRVSRTNWGFMRFPKMGKPPKPWVSILKLSNFGWIWGTPPNGFEFNDSPCRQHTRLFWVPSIFLKMYCIYSHVLHIQLSSSSPCEYNTTWRICVSLQKKGRKHTETLGGSHIFHMSVEALWEFHIRAWLGVTCSFLLMA